MSFRSILSKAGVTWLQLALIVIVGNYRAESCFSQGVGNAPWSPPRNTMFPGHPLDNEVLRKSREIVFRRNLLDEDPDFIHRVDDAKPINITQLESAENLQSLVINMVDLKPSEIKRLAKLRKLRRIEYPDMMQSDDKLGAIATLPYVERLILMGSDTTNASAEHLAKMENLKHLDLRNTKVDSDLFAKHRLVEGVTHLSVSSEEIDDRFLQNDNLPRSLTHLYVARVGESLLPKTLDLSHLKHLRVLFIHGIFSKSQLRALQQQLPDTTINPKTSDQW